MDLDGDMGVELDNTAEEKYYTINNIKNGSVTEHEATAASM